MTIFSQIVHLYMYDSLDKSTHDNETVIKTRKGMPAHFLTTPVKKSEIHVKTMARVMAILWADRRAVSLLTTPGSPWYIHTLYSQFVA